MSAGCVRWRWLSGISDKERSWFLGSLHGRGGFESWMAHLTRGLQDSNFLLKFEGTSHPWERGKSVGQQTSELRASYMKMSESE